MIPEYLQSLRGAALLSLLKRGHDEKAAAHASVLLHPLVEDPRNRRFEKAVRKRSEKFALALRDATPGELSALNREVLADYQELARKHNIGEFYWQTALPPGLMQPND